MMLPCIVALIYQEQEGISYLIVSAAALVIGGLLAIKKPANTVFYLKEGCVATALSWITLSIVGAVPFVLTGEIPNYIDALFETVSGFTTTGASILADVEALSHASLMWRSFTHWIGGMGILVFILAVVPLGGGSTFNLMKAESPGPTVGKIVPKIKKTAGILYTIYFCMTVLEAVLLIIAKMPLFDAVATAFGTAGTGGFGIKNDSMGGYSSAIQWIVTVFMIAFGVNFNAYYLILFKKFKKALSMEEVKWYFIAVFTAVALIFTNTIQIYNNVFEALSKSAFQVASVITTTGFSTADFNAWNSMSKTVLVMLMFIGACAGSTGGGIKVSRFVVAVKTVIKELYSYIHPKSVRKVKLDGKPVDHDVIRATNVYFITFIVLFAGSLFCLSFEGYDLTTNFTAVTAAINNIGPGLELVGPTQNFGIFSPFSKLVLIFDMIAGRLELFPILILFNPTLWKETFSQVNVNIKRKTGK